MKVASGRLCLSALVVGFALANPKGLSAQSIPVTLGGQASSLVGVDFDVPIEIDLSGRSELLGSFALTIRWNPSVLQLVAGQEAAFGHLTVNEDSLAAGAALIAAVNPAGVGGRIIVGVARFRPLIADTTTFRVAVQELYAAGTFADLTASALPSNRAFCPALGRWGDLDADGAANSRDALIALSAAIGLDVSGFQVPVGDVDGNGSTEARDALIILSHSVGLDVSQFRVFAIAPGACVVPATTSLVLDPGDVTVSVGQRVVFTAIATEASGGSAAVTDVFWRSSHPGVAAVGPSGVVTALTPGTSNVTVVRAGGDSATAVVTVAGRHTHWVDALAVNAVNQLGSTTLPFGTIQAALDFAAEGDTVKVRPGRYAEELMVERGVVLEGDTTGGALRPLLSVPGPSLVTMTVVGGRRFEVHNFRSDSLFRAMDVAFADSVLLRNVEFRQTQCGATTIDVDTVTSLEIEQSRLFGSGVYGCGYGVEINLGAGLFRMDSSIVAEYGDGGLYLIGVDSVDIRHSELEHFWGRPLYVCASCAGQRTSALVLSESRVADSYYYESVVVDGFHRAQFDHNVIDSDDDDGIYLYNDAVGVGIVSLLGDSVSAPTSYWLNVRRYDSLTVDSVHAVSEDGAYLDEGRYTSIENSRLKTDLYYGLQIDPYPLDSATVVGRLRNLVIEGPDPGACDRCYTAVDVGWGHWEIDGLTTSNWDEAISFWDADVTIRNVTVSDAWYGVYWYCGKASITNMTATHVEYGVYTSGCALTDSVTVDSSFIGAEYSAIYVDDATAVLRHNTLQGSAGGYYGIQTYNAILRTEGNRVGPFGSRGILYDGLYYSGTYPMTSAELLSDTVTCGGSSYGIYAYDGAISVRNAVVSNCSYGIYTSNADGRLPLATPTEVRGSRVSVPTGGTNGIYASGNDRADLRLVGNTVTGNPSNGAVFVAASTTMPRARVDSNVVDGVPGMGIYAQYADTLLVRWNTVSNLAPGGSMVGPATAILLYYADAGDAAAQVVGNRITAGTGSGIRVHRTLSTDTVTVVVDSNVVQGVDSMGVWVSGYSRARITRNAIDAVGLDAVYVDRSTNDAAATVINNNNFTGSGRNGVNNLDPVFIDATSNWWNDSLGPSGVYGDPQGASQGDAVSNYVTWSPQLTAPEATAPTPAPPAGIALLIAGVATVAASPDVTGVIVPAPASSGESEREALRRDNQQRRAEHAARRADHEARRAARRTDAEKDEAREASRAEAVRRRAEARDPGGER